MTHHSHTTGPFLTGDIAYTGFSSEHQVTLRTPAELVDALPYLLGYRPEDSMVLVALHDRGGRGRFGGRARLGIPPNSEDWPWAARQLAHGLVTGSERRGAKPEQMVAFLWQDPAAGESPREVKNRLRPLAQHLRTECGRLDVPVIEALCISGGRFWSYCCPTDDCCPDEGRPMGLPGTSVLAAAAAYAGIQVRGSLRELRARLLPCRSGAAAQQQERALDSASRTLVPRMLDETDGPAVAVETLRLAERVMRRFAEAPAVSGVAAADLRDDRLLEDEEAARLILGLQDRTTRDRAAAWMEGDEATPALRLWRALARRCVGPYGEHAAAPLTLAGWVAWSSGDELEAREALAMALGADPDYLFARLLHQACNEGLDPESVRRCLRAERAGRQEPTRPPETESDGTTVAPRTARTPATDVPGTAGTADARGTAGTEDACGTAGTADASGTDAPETANAPATDTPTPDARATDAATPPDVPNDAATDTPGTPDPSDTAARSGTQAGRTPQPAARPTGPAARTVEVAPGPPEPGASQGQEAADSTARTSGAAGAGRRRRRPRAGTRGAVAPGRGRNRPGCRADGTRPGARTRPATTAGTRPRPATVDPRDCGDVPHSTPSAPGSEPEDQTGEQPT
ncbi:DUF4192 family protein [Streptomyces thermodiastaticus]